MTTPLFKDKYRTTSCRLKGYDYSLAGAYFITICCANRKCVFGEIVEGKMVLNALGKFAYDEWKNTENIRPNVTIDGFVIMPDHIHGIICIDEQLTNYDSRDVCRDTVHRVSTGNQFPQMEQFGKPTKNSIPTIIRSYKSVLTTHARKNENIHTLWQPKYFDRIIRNENELDRIREYIFLNPQQWEYDTNRPENIYF